MIKDKLLMTNKIKPRGEGGKNYVSHPSALSSPSQYEYWELSSGNRQLVQFLEWAEPSSTHEHKRSFRFISQ